MKTLRIRLKKRERNITFWQRITSHDEMICAWELFSSHVRVVSASVKRHQPQRDFAQLLRFVKCYCESPIYFAFLLLRLIFLSFGTKAMFTQCFFYILFRMWNVRRQKRKRKKTKEFGVFPCERSGKAFKLPFGGWFFCA